MRPNEWLERRSLVFVTRCLFFLEAYDVLYNLCWGWVVFGTMLSLMTSVLSLSGWRACSPLARCVNVRPTLWWVERRKSNPTIQEYVFLDSHGITYTLFWG